jgi:hypothetical protein
MMALRRFDEVGHQFRTISTCDDNILNFHSNRSFSTAQIENKEVVKIRKWFHSLRAGHQNCPQRFKIFKTY